MDTNQALQRHSLSDRASLIRSDIRDKLFCFEVMEARLNQQFSFTSFIHYLLAPTMCQALFRELGTQQ